MRELEQRQSEEWIATKNRRQDIPFVRVAKSGGWKTMLPAVSVDVIESAWGPLMETVGYQRTPARMTESTVIQNLA